MFGFMSSKKLTIQKTGDPNYLPVAHTCFNLLDLPEYATKEKLKYKLLQAIQGTQGFGLVWNLYIYYLKFMTKICLWHKQYLRKNKITFLYQSLFLASLLCSLSFGFLHFLQLFLLLPAKILIFLCFLFFAKISTSFTNSPCEWKNRNCQPLNLEEYKLKLTFRSTTARLRTHHSYNLSISQNFLQRRSCPL